MCPIDSRYLRHFPDYDPPSSSAKTSASAEIARQTAEFLARGNAITTLSHAATGRPAEAHPGFVVKNTLKDSKKDKRKQIAIEAQRKRRLKTLARIYRRAHILSSRPLTRVVNMGEMADRWLLSRYRLDQLFISCGLHIPGGVPGKKRLITPEQEQRLIETIITIR